VKKVWILGLEPLETRYTGEWYLQFKKVFKNLGIKNEFIYGERVEMNLQSKFFLDPTGTNIWKCLGADTRVITEEGSKSIYWIVKNKWKGKVRTIGEDGELLWGKVTGWYKNSLDGRKIFKVSFLDGKLNANGSQRLIGTEDHQILTQRGWIEIKDLTSEDKIATGDPAPGTRASQLITGSLLGDGWLTKSRFCMQHGHKQEEYLDYKASILSNFSPGCGNYKSTKTAGKYIYPNYKSKIYWFCSSYFFKDLRRKWYTKKGKSVPDDIELSDFVLAIWYMDDGSYSKGRPIIGVPSFSLKDCRKLVSKLKEKGFDVRFGKKRKVIHFRGLVIQKPEVGPFSYFKNGKLISVKKSFYPGRIESSSFKFLKRIAPFITPKMRYKLPKELHNIPFAAEAYSSENPISYWKKVRTTPTKIQGSSVFCIDVEKTHNFATLGGVVHNCTQMANMLKKLDKVGDGDIILTWDFWHPALECLAYARSFLQRKFYLMGIAHAGTYDPWDLTYQIGMGSYGKFFEEGWFKILDAIFVATKFHKELILKNRTVEEKKIHITGLPVDIEHVSRFRKPWPKKDKVIIFTGRKSVEKGYDFIQWIIEKFKLPIIVALDQALSKTQYHALLGGSRVVFAPSKQETFGYGIVEGIANGCIPVVPDSLSFCDYVMEKYRYKDFDNIVDLLLLQLNKFDGLDSDQFTQIQKYGYETVIGNMVKVMKETWHEITLLKLKEIR